MILIELIKRKFPNSITLHVHLCSLLITSRSESKNNVSAHQRPLYYQPKWLPATAWTSNVPKYCKPLTISSKISLNQKWFFFRIVDIQEQKKITFCTFESDWGLPLLMGRCYQARVTRRQLSDEPLIKCNIFLLLISFENINRCNKSNTKVKRKTSKILIMKIFFW